MSTTKLRIDLANQVIEAEGSEEFVREVHGKHAHLISMQPKSIKAAGQASNLEGNSSRQKPTKPKSKKSSKNPKLISDFDIYTDPSVEDYVVKFDQQNQYDTFVLVLNYLTEIKSIEKVDVNQIYTCFDGLKIHKSDFWAFLRKVKSDKNYFDFETGSYSDGIYVLSAKGKKRLVELGVK